MVISKFQEGGKAKYSLAQKTSKLQVPASASHNGRKNIDDER